MLTETPDKKHAHEVTPLPDIGPSREGRILLVGSETMFVRFLKFGLEFSGKHRVYCAQTTKTAVCACKQIKPDLLILEEPQIGMTGREVLAEIRDAYRLQPVLPAIMLSPLYSPFVGFQGYEEKDRVMLLPRRVRLKQVGDAVDTMLGCQG
tara:strand:+ start:1071 stop:1523 length:453 start_codon:yes stop_codon:yes gene_type:complete